MIFQNTSIDTQRATTNINTNENTNKIPKHFDKTGVIHPYMHVGHYRPERKHSQ